MMASLTPIFRQLLYRATSTIAPSPKLAPVCLSCRRTFSQTTTRLAGHNKWSKTKHIKKATDARKAKRRTEAAKIIALYSRLYGTDMDFNPKLANAVAEARKVGIPKTNIEAAIARGQGRSSSGAKLEPVTVETMMPGGVAVIMDIETDSRNKIKADFLNPLRKNGGSMSSCGYFFDRRGRAVFSAKPNVDADTALEPAIDCGAEDVDVDDDGIITVWCPPTELSRVTNGMVDTLGLVVLDSRIVWDPKDDLRVSLAKTDDAKSLSNFLSAITAELPDVQGIYTNAVQGSIPDEDWEVIAELID